MPKRYMELQRKPWNDLTVKECVYMNACECLYYGYGFDTLNKCGLGEWVAKMIWNDALNDMARKE